MPVQESSKEYQEKRSKELKNNALVGEPRVEKGYGKKLDSVKSDSEKQPAAEKKATDKKATDKK